MDVSVIFESLPKKGVKKVAEKTGFSHSYVSLVLRGKRDSEAVINAAIDVIAEHKTMLEERANRFKEATA